jgi:hypothetical protein
MKDILNVSPQLAQAASNKKVNGWRGRAARVEVKNK